MTVRLLDYQEQPADMSSRVSRSDEIAQVIYDQAVASARTQTRAELEELTALPGYIGHFLRNLAAGVGAALGANDHRVVAVYAYEAPATRGTDVEPDGAPRLHLLVVVTAPSAALEAFIASLNRALGARLSEFPGAQFNLCGPLLDINVVTEAETRQGVGIARLLSAVMPPIELWQRKE
jgi:hypothetical protein